MGTTGGKVEGGQFLQGKCSSFVIWGSVPLFGGSAAIADRCLALRISRGLVTPPVLVSGRPQALLTRSPTGGFSGPLLDGWHLPAGGPHGGRPHGLPLAGPWVGGRLPCGAGHRCPPALQHADGLSDHPLISPQGNVPGGRFLSCEALAGVGRESSGVGVSAGQPRAIYLLSLPCFSFGGPPCTQSLRRGLRCSRGRASQVGSEARVRPQASAQLSLSPPARFFWCHDGKQRGRSVPSSGRAEPAWRVMGERAGMKAGRPESRSRAAARSRVIPGRLLHVSGPPPRPPL